jgi:hypothetical protein
VTRRFVAAMAISAAAAIGMSGTAVAQESSIPIEITAFAVNMGTVGRAGATTVDITVNSWSTPEQRAGLVKVMLEKNQDALVRALQDQPVRGRFRIPGITGPDPYQLGLGHNIRYAWQEPLPEGGKRILLATDRYISFAEARNQPRSIDYPITLIEIHVNKDGKGQGKFAVATQIRVDKKKKTVEVENYSSEPVRLNDVKVTPKA